MSVRRILGLSLALAVSSGIVTNAAVFAAPPPESSPTGLAADAPALTRDVAVRTMRGPEAPVAPWVIKIYIPGVGAMTGIVINERWVLTVRHALAPVHDDATRLEGWRTAPGATANFPNVGPLTFDDVVIGTGDIAALHLTQPLDLPEFPDVNWDYTPALNNATDIYGYGRIANQDLRMGTGRIFELGVERPGHAPEIVSELSTNSTAEHGDSGGPVRVNQRLVGVQTGLDEANPTDAFWAPLNQEAEIRRRVTALRVTLQPTGDHASASWQVSDDAACSSSHFREKREASACPISGYRVYYKRASDAGLWGMAAHVDVGPDVNNVELPFALSDASVWEVAVEPVTSKGEAGTIEPETRGFVAEEASLPRFTAASSSEGISITVTQKSAAGKDKNQDYFLDGYTVYYSTDKSWRDVKQLSMASANAIVPRDNLVSGKTYQIAVLPRAKHPIYGGEPNPVGLGADGTPILGAGSDLVQTVSPPALLGQFPESSDGQPGAVHAFTGTTATTGISALFSSSADQSVQWLFSKTRDGGYGPIPSNAIPAGGGLVFGSPASPVAPADAGFYKAQVSTWMARNPIQSAPIQLVVQDRGQPRWGDVHAGNYDAACPTGQVITSIEAMGEHTDGVRLQCSWLLDSQMQIGKAGASSVHSIDGVAVGWPDRTAQYQCPANSYLTEVGITESLFSGVQPSFVCTTFRTSLGQFSTIQQASTPDKGEIVAKHMCTPFNNDIHEVLNGPRPLTTVGITGFTWKFYRKINLLSSFGLFAGPTSITCAATAPQ